VVFEKITPRLGAFCDDIDLRSISPVQAEVLRECLSDRGVIVFRSQELTRPEHKRLASLFGRIRPGAIAGSRSDDPEVMSVITDGNTRQIAGENWHADLSCESRPPAVSVFRLIQAPETKCGGDTLFVDMSEVYYSFSDCFRKLLDSMSAIHDGGKPYRHTDHEDRGRENFPVSVHPVVLRHPDTRAPALYVNPTFTTTLCELSRQESSAILGLIENRLNACVEMQCRISTKAGDVLVWDNFRVQHKAVWDYRPMTRYGERISVVSDHFDRYTVLEGR